MAGRKFRPRRDRRRAGNGSIRTAHRRCALVAVRLRFGLRQDRSGAVIGRSKRTRHQHHRQRRRAAVGNPRREKVKGATGGLLRKIGERGILVIKDVTSILSADRNTRGAVLAALREIHDRKYERNVGTDGGRTLTWTGRITVVGAVTTAWDTAHAVVAACGDRFVLIRADSTTGRAEAAH